jgi:hypothetical protein
LAINQGTAAIIPIQISEESVMCVPRTACLGVVVCALLAGAARAGDEKAKVTEKDFRRSAALLLEDPLGKAAGDHAKLILVFVANSPNTTVMLGEEELKWLGKKEDKRGLLLMSAYLAGNVAAQLNSGVDRNDRYSGLMYLFQVYRKARAADKEFRIAEVDKLLKMHAEERLVSHLAEVEKRQPSKLSAEEKEAARKFREKKEREEKEKKEK